MNTVTNLRFSYNARKSLNRRGTVSFSRRTLLHGISYCLKVNGRKINFVDGDKCRDSESKFTAHIFWVISFEL
jgi:hypothetical protein